MKWIKRLIWAILGAAASAMIFAWRGGIQFGDEFVANVSGAAVGGVITVGLAMFMFRHERHLAARDASAAEQRNWSAAIREALRHVRAVRECVNDARLISVNERDLRADAIVHAARLCNRRLKDHDLTDFPLRHALKAAAKEGYTAATRLRRAVDQGGMSHADEPAPAADQICSEVIEVLDKLIADYTTRRSLPALQ